MSTFRGESSQGKTSVEEANDSDFSLREPEYIAKSMYILLNPLFGRKSMLLQTDVHNGVVFQEVVLPSLHLAHAQNVCYGVTVIKSQFYFIGGCPIPSRTPLNHFSIFDSTTSSWKTGPPLNQPRLCPVVLNYRNKLFVFGSKRCYPWAPTLTPESFAEYYDFGLDKWSYLPPPPQEFFDEDNYISSHAFSEARGEVYFWMSGLGVYTYHFIFKTWTPFQIYHPNFIFDPDVGYRWSNTAIVLGPFVIWHHFGTIYAFKDVILPIYTFDKRVQMFGDPSEKQPSKSYLVNLGKGKLCLVYGSQHINDLECIRCHLFNVRFSGNSVDIQLTLTHEGCDFFNHEGYRISSVFTMDHDMELKEDIHLIEKIPPSSEDHDMELKEDIHLVENIPSLL